MAGEGGGGGGVFGGVGGGGGVISHVLPPGISPRDTRVSAASNPATSPGVYRALASATDTNAPARGL